MTEKTGKEQPLTAGDQSQELLPYPRGAMRRALLWPLIRLYDAAAASRGLLYDWGVFKSQRLDRPVISIGNLSFGGTGKTPVCSAFMGILIEQGYKVAVLSRGYGRLEPKTSRRVEPDGDWRYYGDEPMMLARRHPEALVCVGPTRIKAAMAAQAYRPDVFLLDDGFQHRRLQRDGDVALIDVTQPRADSWSADLFRERWSALKRADLVFLTRVEPGKNYQSWKDRIAIANPSAPIHEIGFRPRSVRFLDGRADAPLTWPRGRRVGAYSGIARPERFFDSLWTLGAVPAVTLPLRDHEPLSPRHWRELVEKCRAQKIDVILTTEKDAVKLDPTRNFGIDLGFLPIEVHGATLESVAELLKNWTLRVDE